MAYELFLLIGGVLALAMGASLAVEGFRNVARYFKVSELFVGLTVASIGTSIPEIAVSVTGAIDKLKGLDTSGIVVGDAIGSALTQITFMVGIVALFGVLYINKRTWKRDGFMLLASIGIFFLVAFDGIITKVEGGLMILIYLTYFGNLIREERKYALLPGPRPIIPFWQDIFLIIAGVFLVLFSSDLVIQSAVTLAESLEVSSLVIGILIVGFGTSLPELVISIRAVSTGAIGLSVGNLVGSNITDLLLSLGVGALISGFFVEDIALQFDLPVLFWFSLLFLALFRTRFRVEKREGYWLIGAYLVYVVARLFPLVRAAILG